MKRAATAWTALANYLPPRPFARAMAIAWGAFALALTFTLMSWRHAVGNADGIAQQQFQFESQLAHDAIRERMADYEQLLRGTGALFAASVFVNRHEWQTYVQTLQAEQRYPGIQGIGFAQHIWPHERATHIRAVRAEGFADYSIHPAGERSEYTPVVYIEPFAGRNLRAFSYDMFSEPVRRAAMHGQHGEAPARFVREMPLEVAGRTWTLRFSSPPAFEADVADPYPQLILGGGVTVSLLVFLLIAATVAAREKDLRAKSILDSAKEALRASEERFRMMFEHAPHAFIMVDTKGVIALANAQTEKMFGYGREELFGCSVDTLVPERFRTEHAHLRAGYAAAPTARPMQRGSQLFARRKDGSELHVEIGLNPIQANGSSFVLVSIIDITERYQGQRATEEALRAKTNFMNNVTHELRTPLNCVIGFCELLKDEDVAGPLNAKQSEFVADIHDSGLRLLKLVEGMLDMARLDTNAEGLEREPVDIGAVLQERVAAHRNATEERGITVGLEVAANVGNVPLDLDALCRMFDALLDNAVKFNRASGMIMVSARRADGRLEIAVADTGIGIASADLPKLFQPLVQLDATLARTYGGIGLGLTLVKRLVERHGGTIDVQSEPGKGSTFTLYLPCP